jgi:hypothetical protein
MKAKKRLNDDVLYEMMQGSVLEALKKAKMNPSKNDPKIIGEVISIILEDEDLKYLFAKVVSERKKSPKVLAKMMMRDWFKMKGYL